MFFQTNKKSIISADILSNFNTAQTSKTLCSRDHSCSDWPTAILLWNTHSSFRKGSLEYSESKKENISDAKRPEYIHPSTIQQSTPFNTIDQSALLLILWYTHTVIPRGRSINLLRIVHLFIQSFVHLVGASILLLTM